jgi:hypothetical protein
VENTPSNISQTEGAVLKGGELDGKEKSIKLLSRLKAAFIANSWPSTFTPVMPSMLAYAITVPTIGDLFWNVAELPTFQSTSFSMTLFVRTILRLAPT